MWPLNSWVIFCWFSSYMAVHMSSFVFIFTKRLTLPSLPSVHVHQFFTATQHFAVSLWVWNHEAFRNVALESWNEKWMCFFRSFSTGKKLSCRLFGSLFAGPLTWKFVHDTEIPCSSWAVFFPQFVLDPWTSTSKHLLPRRWALISAVGSTAPESFQARRFPCSILGQTAKLKWHEASLSWAFSWQSLASSLRQREPPKPRHGWKQEVLDISYLTSPLARLHHQHNGGDDDDHDDQPPPNLMNSWIKSKSLSLCSIDTIIIIIISIIPFITSSSSSVTLSQ